MSDIADRLNEIRERITSACARAGRPVNSVELVAVSKTKGPQAALDMIEPLGERLSGYFYFHGAKGGLLLQLDRKSEARESFDRAIALASTAAEAAHIRMHIDRLIAESEGRG